MTFNRNLFLLFTCLQPENILIPTEDVNSFNPAVRESFQYLSESRPAHSQPGREQKIKWISKQKHVYQLFVWHGFSYTHILDEFPPQKILLLSLPKASEKDYQLVEDVQEAMSDLTHSGRSHPFTEWRGVQGPSSLPDAHSKGRTLLQRYRLSSVRRFKAERGDPGCCGQSLQAMQIPKLHTVQKSCIIFLMFLRRSLTFWLKSSGSLCSSASKQKTVCLWTQKARCHN